MVLTLDAYAPLPSDLSLNYEDVKKVVLMAYELVSKAYRRGSDGPQPPLGRSFSAPRPPVLQKLSGDGGMTSGVKESDRVIIFFCMVMVILLITVLF